VGQYENWKACQALFPHAQAAVACRPAGGSALGEWASVLFEAAWYANDMGNYDEEYVNTLGVTASVQEQIYGGQPERHHSPNLGSEQIPTGSKPALPTTQQKRQFKCPIS